MNITFDKFKTDETIAISFSKYYMQLVTPSHEYYRCTFIKSTNIPEDQLKKMVGDIRTAVTGRLYMPYRLWSFQITDDYIRVIGDGSCMRYDIVTRIKWRRAA